MAKQVADVAPWVRRRLRPGGGGILVMAAAIAVFGYEIARPGPPAAERHPSQVAAECAWAAWAWLGMATAADVILAGEVTLAAQALPAALWEGAEAAVNLPRWFAWAWAVAGGLRCAEALAGAPHNGPARAAHHSGAWEFAVRAGGYAAQALGPGHVEPLAELAGEALAAGAQLAGPGARSVLASLVVARGAAWAASERIRLERRHERTTVAGRRLASAHYEDALRTGWASRGAERRAVLWAHAPSLVLLCGACACLWWLPAVVDTSHAGLVQRALELPLWSAFAAFGLNLAAVKIALIGAAGLVVVGPVVALLLHEAASLPLDWAAATEHFEDYEEILEAAAGAARATSALGGQDPNFVRALLDDGDDRPRGSAPPAADPAGAVDAAGAAVEEEAHLQCVATAARAARQRWRQAATEARVIRDHARRDRLLRGVDAACQAAGQMAAGLILLAPRLVGSFVAQACTGMGAAIAAVAEACRAQPATGGQGAAKPRGTAAADTQATSHGTPASAGSPEGEAPGAEQGVTGQEAAAASSTLISHATATTAAEPADQAPEEALESIGACKSEVRAEAATRGARVSWSQLAPRELDGLESIEEGRTEARTEAAERTENNSRGARAPRTPARAARAALSPRTPEPGSRQADDAPPGPGAQLTQAPRTATATGLAGQRRKEGRWLWFDRGVYPPDFEPVEKEARCLGRARAAMEEIEATDPRFRPPEDSRAVAPSAEALLAGLQQGRARGASWRGARDRAPGASTWAPEAAASSTPAGCGPDKPQACGGGWRPAESAQTPAGATRASSPPAATGQGRPPLRAGPAIGATRAPPGRRTRAPAEAAAEAAQPSGGAEPAAAGSDLDTPAQRPAPGQRRLRTKGEAADAAKHRGAIRREAARARAADGQPHWMLRARRGAMASTAPPSTKKDAGTVLRHVCGSGRPQRALAQMAHAKGLAPYALLSSLLRVAGAAAAGTGPAPGAGGLAPMETIVAAAVAGALCGILFCVACWRLRGSIGHTERGAPRRTGRRQRPAGHTRPPRPPRPRHDSTPLARPPAWRAARRAGGRRWGEPHLTAWRGWRRRAQEARQRAAQQGAEATLSGTAGSSRRERRTRQRQARKNRATVDEEELLRPPGAARLSAIHTLAWARASADKRRLADGRVPSTESPASAPPRRAKSRHGGRPARIATAVLIVAATMTAIPTDHNPYTGVRVGEADEPGPPTRGGRSAGAGAGHPGRRRGGAPRLAGISGELPRRGQPGSATADA